MAPDYHDAPGGPYLTVGDLANAAGRQPLTSHGDRASWPQPTDEEPDMEDYMHDSMFGDEGSYATDGCTIEPDGVCSHGHPSWELWWGII